MAEIVARHVIEHVESVRSVMDELWRILASEGRLFVYVPHFTHFQALTHPEHRHAFHYNSMAMFTAAAGEPYTTRLWTVISAHLHFHSRLLERVFNRHKYVYTSTILAYLFPAFEIEFVMQPVKEPVSPTMGDHGPIDL